MTRIQDEQIHREFDFPKMRVPEFNELEKELKEYPSEHEFMIAKGALSRDKDDHVSIVIEATGYAADGTMTGRIYPCLYETYINKFEQLGWYIGKKNQELEEQSDQQ